MSIVAEVMFKDCKRLIQAAFPGAKTRRAVSIRTQERYGVIDYWDEGSRYESRFLNIVDPGSFYLITRSDLGSSAGPTKKQGNPFNLDIYDVVLDDSFAIVEHVISQGKSLGYRIYLYPSLAETYRSRILDK